MAERDVIDGLIATYRELNAKVRQQPEERLRRRDAGGAVREVVTRLRDRELAVAEALKQRLTGVPMPEIFDENEAPVVGTETEDDTTSARISQFGTAREATLVRLRGLSAEEWGHAPEGGGQPIRAETRQLHDNDRRPLERIAGLLGAPAPTVGTHPQPAAPTLRDRK